MRKTLLHPQSGSSYGVPADWRRVEVTEMSDLLRVVELRRRLVLQVGGADRSRCVVGHGSVQHQCTTSELDRREDETPLRADTPSGSTSSAPVEDKPAAGPSVFVKHEFGNWLPLAAKRTGRRGRQSGGDRGPGEAQETEAFSWDDDFVNEGGGE